MDDVQTRLPYIISEIHGRLPKHTSHVSSMSFVYSMSQIAECRKIQSNCRCSAWIDASRGVGELETNDPDYAYKYMIMPESIFDIYNNVRKIYSKLSGYGRCYDPIITENN